MTEEFDAANSVFQSQASPTYNLFDSTSVCLATFLGSPVAGTSLMALNYRRMGKGKNAIAALALGLGVTGLAIACANLIPAYASTAVAISLVVAVKNAAKSLQGAAVQQHVGNGGKLVSRWTASGLGLTFMALIFGGILLFEFGRVSAAKVTVGPNDDIYYSGSATKQDASNLGDALKTVGYFSDKGTSVFLAKGKNGTAVSFVVKEGVWQQAEMIAAFEEIVREIAPSVGGFPIKLHLLNSARDSMKEVTVGRVVIGARDEIYYLGSALESEAKALGQSLKSAGFFEDRGVTVFLSKDDNGTAVAFVVTEGSWETPERVPVFATLVRLSAPALGGLPIRLRFLDSKLETKKEVTVR
jgi:hypothetical protein